MQNKCIGIFLPYSSYGLVSANAFEKVFFMECLTKTVQSLGYFTIAYKYFSSIDFIQNNPGHVYSIITKTFIN